MGGPAVAISGLTTGSFNMLEKQEKRVHLQTCTFSSSVSKNDRRENVAQVNALSPDAWNLSSRCRSADDSRHQIYIHLAFTQSTCAENTSSVLRKGPRMRGKKMRKKKTRRTSAPLRLKGRWTVSIQDPACLWLRRCWPAPLSAIWLC